MKKNPSISKKNARLNTKKNPSELESPANYKMHYVSWQFTYIDQESDWGIEHLRPKYKLELSNQSEDQLCEIIDDNSELSYVIIDKERLYYAVVFGKRVLISKRQWYELQIKFLTKSRDYHNGRLQYVNEQIKGYEEQLNDPLH